MLIIKITVTKMVQSLYFLIKKKTTKKKSIPNLSI